MPTMKHLAEDILKSHSQNEAPIDVYSIAQATPRITIDSADFGPHGPMSNIYKSHVTPHNFYVHINEALTGPQQRYALARALKLCRIDTTVNPFVYPIIDSPDILLPFLDESATVFAENLLVPLPLLEEALKETNSLDKLARKFNAPRDVVTNQWLALMTQKKNTEDDE